MGIVNIRELLEFPTNPDNSSDTVVGGVHYNLTTLKQWNYTYYSNGTMSNNSWCILSFDEYTPKLLYANGTFVNSTTCYSPINPMGTRGKIGIAFTVFYAISIMFTLIHLRKHGRLFLPAEVRFRPVGRRWQWYWLIAAAALGMVAGIGSVDVDRYYLPEFPIVLTNLGYFLQLICVMGAVWEGVRHWGSWQERQLIDPNPFVLPQDDRRGKTEFYLPLVFYMFNFLSFFMTVPRSWNPIEEQRSPEQTAAVGKPNATDGRFKAGAFLLFCAWLVICFSLRHSLHWYKPKNRGSLNSFIGVFRYTPIKFILIIPLTLVMIAYSALAVFDFSLSPLNIHGNIAFIYGLGWTPIALIILIFEIAGYIDPNEDKELIRQRRIRGAEIDAEMGYTKKPHWWSRLHDNHNLSVQAAIAKNVREVGGGAATARGVERNIEMDILARKENESKSKTPEAVRIGASLLFPTRTETTPLANPFSSPYSDAKSPGESRGRGRVGADDLSSTTTRRPAESERSNSTASGTTLNGPPQQIRSMLDI